MSNWLLATAGAEFVGAGIWAILGHEPGWTLLFGGLFLVASAFRRT